MNIKRGAMAYQQFQRKKGKEAFLLFNSDLPTKGWRDTGRSQSSHHQYPKTSSYIISFWTFLCLGTVTFIQEKSKSVDSYSNKSIVWRNTTNGKTRKEAINSVTWKEHFSCFSYFVGCNTFISERAVKSEANTFHPTSL